MNDYLIDRETLGRFVDELIKRKPMPSATAEEADKKREELMAALDRHVGVAIFSQFTPEQNAEFKQKMSADDTTVDTYAEFFEKAGIDVEKTMTEAMKAFGIEYLGGQNA